MTSIQDIRVEALSLPDPEVREICTRLVDGLANRVATNTTRWTFKSLSKLAQRQPDDPLLQRCIQILTTRPRVKILDMHFLFFDPLVPDSIGEPIDDEEVAAAYSQGFLVDPLKGREIQNFEKALVPYFQIVEGLEAHGSHR
ncbi:hypothetical protein [Novilysobacter erysipheiresistens]|uniref:Uncharacterized protein n=1 Tax=Novilysobacter erysipheiresistens TaxID=1749332 RepID=A0ABU7YZC0_9GAMM